MHSLTFLLALASLLPASIPSTQDDADADGNKLVTVTLKSERDGPQPGQSFTLGIHCKVEPRWHVYWGENAGDSGLAFKSTVTGPAGFEIGRVQCPWPKREEAEGDIVTFVQDGEFMMLVDVKVPATAKIGETLKFDVACRWLVCTDVCLTGSGTASLELVVAEKAKPANEALFAKWRARLPRPWSELPRAMATWSGEMSAPKLRVVVPGASAVEFFPYKSATTTMTARNIAIGKQGGTVTIDFGFKPAAPGDKPQASGVLWVKTEKEETSYLLEKTFTE